MTTFRTYPQTGLKEDRIAALSEKLARVADARKMATTEVWADAWNGYERELLERLLGCEPSDDIQRYRLQIGIEAARHARRAIENDGTGEAALLKELDILEGRKAPPIA